MRRRGEREASPARRPPPDAPRVRDACARDGVLNDDGFDDDCNDSFGARDDRDVRDDFLFDPDDADFIVDVLPAPFEVRSPLPFVPARFSSSRRASSFASSGVR